MTSSKVLSLDKSKLNKFYFVLCSLIRTFAGMIFYFSGTGNTRWAAQTLAERTGEHLISIAEEMKKDVNDYTLAEGERLGFCFPTHGWQPPRIVREFIRHSTFHLPTSPKGESEGAPYIFALTTHGDSMGKTMDILNKELKAKGLHTDSIFSLTMPESYVCLPFMYTDTPERERQKIDKATKALEEIAAIISQNKKGVVQTTEGPIPRFFSYVVGAYFNGHMITDRKFMVDEDVCIKCGKCVKVCPVDNISGTPPTWSHHGQCTCCLACYHHCPVHAINYGERTRKRGQYFFKLKKKD